MEPLIARRDLACKGGSCAARKIPFAGGTRGLRVVLISTTVILAVAGTSDDDAPLSSPPTLSDRGIIVSNDSRRDAREIRSRVRFARDWPRRGLPRRDYIGWIIRNTLIRVSPRIAGLSSPKTAAAFRRRDLFIAGNNSGLTIEGAFSSCRLSSPRTHLSVEYVNYPAW